MKKIIIIVLILQSSFLKAQKTESISLNGEWKLCYGIYDRNSSLIPDELKNKDWPVIKATVPGNVELDMLTAGIIANPEIGSNIYDLRKYEAYQWWYYRKFETPHYGKSDRVQLVFEGLDCFGTIMLTL